MRGLILAVLLLYPLHSFGKSYVVGVESLAYYPFYVDEKGSYQGFARELFDAFAQSQSIELTYQPMSVPELFASLLDESIDLKFPDNQYWKSNLKQGHKIHYSVEIISYVDGALVLFENKEKGMNFLKKLGTIKGFTPFPYLKLVEEKKIEVIEYNELDHLITALFKKKVDAGYFNILMAEHFLFNVSMENLMKVNTSRPNIVFDPSLPYSQSHYKLSSKNHPELIDAFNEFFLSDQEHIKLLKRKYKIGEFVN
ncbi:MAG: transporter substrate-binding domain-containing protein [Kangiellaceae bacterium]|nr:transporter substrate-binding domain-containing protein [Kangiellaceae bacterium]MCW8999338.1 transporter substrate-binding domain-containing protein [Kangiellaceae bacterium]MCW9017074.1 transporter substrate-binding domain-containing protein [Kangiellaceae bacterium]